MRQTRSMAARARAHALATTPLPRDTDEAEPDHRVTHAGAVRPAPRLATPPVLVTIDHTAFPFIIDEIVAYSDIESLIALRTASRAFRDRVDRLLCKHASVGRADDGRLALSVPALVSIPVSSRGNGLSFCPEAVETADVIPMDWPETAPVERFTSLTTVRRFGKMVWTPGPHCLPNATTTVDFVDFSAPHIFSCRVLLPPQTRRHILHVGWNEAVEEFQRYLITMDQVNLDECVLVLHPQWCPSGSVSIKQPPYFPNAFEYIFAMYVCRLLLLGRSATVVGTEAIHPGQFGEGADSPRTPDSAQLFLDLANEYNTPVDRLRFLSVDEWLAELGDRAEIEGEWPMKPCRRCAALLPLGLACSCRQSRRSAAR